MLLGLDVQGWNAWREEYPEISPNLSDLPLSLRHPDGTNFSRYNLIGAHLNIPICDHTDLQGASLFRPNLSNASAPGAGLSGSDAGRGKLPG